MTLPEQIYIDRRQHSRATINNCMFDANLKFGRIIDISTEGMAFYYVDSKAWPEKETLRGSLCYKNARPIRNLQVSTVTDTEMPNSSLPGTISVHRRSVRFINLSHMQKIKLNELLNHFMHE